MQRGGLEPGESLEHYTVVSVIGRGGMGTVYAARDRKLERIVALKVLHRSTGTTSDAWSLILHEARVLARLSHPNIVAVFDAGITDQHLYLVMEYVRGTTLDEWLADEWRSTTEIVKAFIEAGRGLVAAHEAGVIHGDFKPNNVLLGDDDRIRVVDFGVARIGPNLDSALVNTARGLMQTQTLADSAISTIRNTDGPIIGTPAFMAPEQFLQSGLDDRSDQFSFCVALYRAVFGVKPFEGDTLETLVENVINGRLQPAPVKNRYERHIADALARGMSVRPDYRYPSMNELLADLQQPASRGRRVLTFSAAALAIAAVSGGVAVVLDRGTSSPPCTDSERQLQGVWDKDTKAAIRTGLEGPSGQSAWAIIEPVLDRYTATWTDAHRAACEATHIHHEQSEALLDLRMACLQGKQHELEILRDLLLEPEPGQVPRLIEATHRLSDIAECEDLDALSAPIRPPTDPEAREAEQRLRDLAAELRVLNHAGRFQLAIEQSEPALREARERKLSRALSEILLQRGIAERHAGLLEPAEASLQESAAAAESARDQLGKVRAWAQLIFVVGHDQITDRWRPWERLGTAALSGLKGAAAAGPARMLRSAIGAAHGAHGEVVEAYAALKEAERMAERDDAKADLAFVTGALGTGLFHMGRLDEARTYLARSLALRRAIYGPDHPEVAEALNNLGLVRAAQGDLGAAKKLVTKALALREKATPPNPAELAESYSNIGTLHFNLNEFQEAQTWFKKGLKTERASLRPRHPSIAGSLYNLAMTYTRLEQGEKAQPLFEEAASIIEENSGYFNRTALLFDLARGMREAGAEPARARELAEMARAELAAQEPADTAAIQEIDAWLADE